MSRTSSHSDAGLDAALPWRRSRLRRAGFDARLAAEIAADLRYDLGAIVALTDRGCPPRLAARIAAPLDERRP
ncbi:hypothetical protein FSW04_24350 [Baekduia soli]|uniref:Uncharacterized protein n=1 Tax=Baekduia soli TaxID=496014 RepID=A0A5B8UBM1_9ACTN|nr:hypothetical protein [Baekduia soli]QEC50407.1 hypothetical protein FSW04_24350 [Baekduia soli]